jgi:hypothetical protein
MSSQTVIPSEARNLGRGWLPSLETLRAAQAGTTAKAMSR